MSRFGITVEHCKYDVLFFNELHLPILFCSLLLEKVFLSDTTMHLFLQTNLTIKEMKDYIEGKISAFSLDSLWKANGVKENCRYINNE